MSNGDVKINGLAGTGTRILTTDANGKLGVGPTIITPVIPCSDPLLLAWQLKSNVSPNIAYTCWNQVGVGTDDPQKNLGVKGGARFFNFNNHSKYLDVEHDGANASINSTDNILLNYYSGKDIAMNTGTTKGNVETGGNTFLATGNGKNVGIGLTNPNSAYRLDVAGEINATGLRINNTSLNLATQWTTALTLGDIHYDGGNVGIGTNTPQNKLEIAHNISSGGINIDRLNSTIEKSQISFRQMGIEKWALGIGMTEQQNEDNFYIYGGQTPSAKLFIDKKGSIGIGATSPSLFMNVPNPPTANDPESVLLHLSGNAPTIRLENTNGTGGNETSDFVITSANGFGRLISDKGISFFINADQTYQGLDNFFAIFKNADHWNGNEVPLFKVNNDGYVGCRGVKVTQSTFPDYVFKSDYDLMGIEELGSYINKNKKLPGLPSAEQVAKEGLDVGEVTNKLVEKVEELTLHIIQLQKELNDLKNLQSK